MSVTAKRAPKGIRCDGCGRDAQTLVNIGVPPGEYTFASCWTCFDKMAVAVRAVEHDFLTGGLSPARTT